MVDTERNTLCQYLVLNSHLVAFLVTLPKKCSSILFMLQGRVFGMLLKWEKLLWLLKNAN